MPCMCIKAICRFPILSDFELDSAVSEHFENDDIECLTAQVESATKRSELLRIRGSGSKFFFGRPIQGTVVDVRGHSGVVSYEPSELVLTARAGTRISEIDEVLLSGGQYLPFEPPCFGSDSTLGGTVACGLSGPRRPYTGSVRDFILGVKCINGKAEVLSFGGQVMKNVAGYDVSRLMAGALGTLGIITEVSLKVLPVPETESTRILELGEGQAIQRMNELAQLPLPISAMSHEDKLLRIRLSGTDRGVAAAVEKIGGEADRQDSTYWSDLREHQLPFFRGGETLWRLSVPSTTSPLNLSGEWIIDWGGAQRWGYSAQSPQEIMESAKQAGGHATIFRSSEHSDLRFSPLTDELMHYHKRLKNAFDPCNIFNRGIMYECL